MRDALDRLDEACEDLFLALAAMLEPAVERVNDAIIRLAHLFTKE